MSALSAPNVVVEEGEKKTEQINGTPEVTYQALSQYWVQLN